MSDRGFLLIEASLAYIILAFALTALVPVFCIALQANARSERVMVATDLSEQLLEEISLRRWDETTPRPLAYTAAPSAIGTDPGETATPPDKRKFDDLDDFDGWTESGVMDPIMRPVPEFAQYSRTVAVAYVDAALADSASPTDFKRITVCTKPPRLAPVCVTALRTNR